MSLLRLDQGLAAPHVRSRSPKARITRCLGTPPAGRSTRSYLLRSCRSAESSSRKLRSSNPDRLLQALNHRQGRLTPKCGGSPRRRERHRPLLIKRGNSGRPAINDPAIDGVIESKTRGELALASLIGTITTPRNNSFGEPKEIVLPGDDYLNPDGLGGRLLGAAP